MPEIVTTVGFSLVLPSGHIETVKQGKSTVSDEVANHWFTKAHLVGVPRGRMPLVEGENGLKIEADEAGQRVTPVYLPDPNGPPVRQEGPLSWSQESPTAKADAEQRAKDAGTQPSEPVDGRAELTKMQADKKAESKPQVVVQQVPTPAAQPAQPALPSPAK